MSEYRDKAKELINKFKPIIYDKSGQVFGSHHGIIMEQRKQCALICVDEIIKEASECLCYSDGNIEYWQKVKQEIEKL